MEVALSLCRVQSVDSASRTDWTHSFCVKLQYTLLANRRDDHSIAVQRNKAEPNEISENKNPMKVEKITNMKDNTVLGKRV